MIKFIPAIVAAVVAAVTASIIVRKRNTCKEEK